MIDELILLERLESWKACYDAEVGLEREDEEAYTKIKDHIFATKEETKLKELIIKLQKELHKKWQEELDWINIVCELYNEIEKLKKNQPEVNEEWIEKKARGMYQTSMCFPYNTPDTIVYKCKKFIRSIVEEIQPKQPEVSEPGGLKPGEYMHEWLEQDAVRLDLPAEEIIEALARDNKLLKDKLDNQLEMDEKFFEEWGGAFFDLDTHHVDEYIDMCREMLEEARIRTKKK